MKSSRHIPVQALALIVLAAFACTISAQSAGGAFQLTQSVVAGGGGTSTGGGTLRLDGTIGQGVLGVSQNGSFVLVGGFPQGENLVAGVGSISGHVTLAANNAPIANVRVTLEVSPSISVLTDANGNYSFSNLSVGSYILTASRQNFSFSPISNPVTISGNDNHTANFTATITSIEPQIAGGAILISEFRLGGTIPTDEFIELYNNTDSAIDISGYRVDAIEGYTIVIPSGTVIAARHHYLIANSAGYSLAGSAAPDLTYNLFDLPADTGLALMDATNKVIDSVGFTTTVSPYKEGQGLSSILDTAQYSYVRNLASGRPLDTGDNATDFVLVANDPAAVTNGVAMLGAPGPEGSTSPIQQLNINSTLIEPTFGPTVAPNRVRVGSGNAGTLSIRRRFTNNTGSTVTRLRFRVVGITTLNSPGYLPGGGQADLRAINSNDIGVTTTLGALTVKGLTLETPPAISNLGGGLNNTYSVVLPNGGLNPGASIDVQFVLQVVQNGSFSFFVTIEGTP